MKALLRLFVFVSLVSCGPREKKSNTYQWQNDIANWNGLLTDVIVKDIFTPPVASRIYAYANLAAYEVMAAHSDNYQSLSAQMMGFDIIPKSDGQIVPEVASVVAFVTAAKPLVYSASMLDSLESTFLTKQLKYFDEDILETSVKYGKLVGSTIGKRAQKDGYTERQALPRYHLQNDPGRWKPTPPDYMPAIEPHWNTISPFVIDSAKQFVPDQPTAFATDKSSKFYEEVLEVYNTVNKVDEEQLEIAKFWDCNPNISYTRGHMMFFEQKISPGGHWIMIAGIASKVKKYR